MTSKAATTDASGRARSRNSAARRRRSKTRARASARRRRRHAAPGAASFVSPASSSARWRFAAGARSADIGVRETATRGRRSRLRRRAMAADARSAHARAPRRGSCRTPHPRTPRRRARDPPFARVRANASACDRARAENDPRAADPRALIRRRSMTSMSRTRVARREKGLTSQFLLVQRAHSRPFTQRDVAYAARPRVRYPHAPSRRWDESRLEISTGDFTPATSSRSSPTPSLARLAPPTRKESPRYPVFPNASARRCIGGASNMLSGRGWIIPRSDGSPQHTKNTGTPGLAAQPNHR